jgi:invasion protein IalB
MTKQRLFAAVFVRIYRGMRKSSLLLAAGLLVPCVIAAAPAKAPESPARKSIGTFDDWQAATNVEAGQTVCYAFTRGKAASRKLPGRGDVVLTVTRRGSAQDAVALNAGFVYAANASVAVQIDKLAVDFYTAQRYAFARDGLAVIAALQKASTATAKSPVSKAADVTDNFSLKGFKLAYDAITKACPAK